MLKWAQRKILQEYLKRKVHKEVDKIMAKVLKEIDKGLAKVPGDEKKTLIGLSLTSVLVVVDLLDKFVTDPTIHAAIDRVGELFPSWDIFVTTGLTAFGLLHKLIKTFTRK